MAKSCQTGRAEAKAHKKHTKTAPRSPKSAPSVHPGRGHEPMMREALLARAASTTPRHAFRFFDLPSELRLRIYEMILLVPWAVDLHPVRYWSRLALFLVSHRMHEEAYRVFFAQPIRLFPTHGAYIHSKRPLVAMLPVRYRRAIACIELRLGPGWTSPPRCQRIDDSLGLADCTRLRVLKVFVELDPSDAIFLGFRGVGATEETYQTFSLELLRKIFAQVPTLETVEIDAYPAVRSDGPLITSLVRAIRHADKRLEWSSLRQWD